MSAEATDVRSALTAAFSAAETSTSSGGGSPPPSDTPPSDTGGEPPAATGGTPATDAPATGGTPTTGTGEPPKPPKDGPTGGAAPVATGGQQPPESKAPATWKPAVREHWGKLDPAVREEIMRREGEIARALTETGDARRFHREMTEALAPFSHLLSMNKMSPAQNVREVFTMINNLRLGSPAQRSELLAQIVMDYGADLPALDAALARRLGKGGAPRGGASGGNGGADIDAAIQRHLNPLIAPLREFADGRAAAQKQENERLEKELNDFIADPKNEFVNDVLQEMSDLLGVYAGRGVKLSLSDAYQKAIMLHPEISKILSQRQIDGVARKKADEAAAALQAGASVSSSTGAASLPTPSDADNLRKTLESAFDVHSRATR